MNFKENYAIKGLVQETGKAPNGVEIIPKEVKILNLANQPLPMDPTEKVKAGIDTRLDSRFLDIRKENVSAIFKIKDQMFHTVRDFFYDNRFYEINTPKLVVSATEKGTELFPITYFEREAFLGQVQSWHAPSTTLSDDTNATMNASRAISRPTTRHRLRRKKRSLKPPLQRRAIGANLRQAGA